MKIPIFLDWDGVIVDSLKLYLNLFKSLCQTHNKTLPITDADGFREWYRPDWEFNFRELGFTRTEYLDICATYPKTLDYGEAEVFPGVKDMITSLATERDMIVVSTAPTSNIKQRLDALGLLEKFSMVTGSDDGSTDKIQRLAKIGAQLGTERGIMVGDTDLDIIAGRENNLTTVGVTYGWISSQRVKAAKPNYLVEEPGKLEATLRRALADQGCLSGSLA